MFAPKERPDFRRAVSQLVVTLAEADAAARFGERGHNNGGPDVIRMRSEDGTGSPADTDGAWCASYVSWCYMRAMEQARAAYGMPDARLWFKPSRGAKRLVDSAARSGSKIADPMQIERGDLILKTRVGGHHIMIATGPYDPSRKLIPMVDGNRGSFPAIVDLGYIAPRDIDYAARPW